MNNEYLAETRMLTFSDPQIVSLVASKKWLELDEFHKIKAIYEYVQNDILFGYNVSDTLDATEVLNDGIGQCNTKATLLMALLRAVNIPCRLRAFKVSKDFQRGATSGIIALLAPKYILHTWVEVFYQNKWVILEGVITDKKYYEAVKKKFPNHSGVFKKYAIATNDLKKAAIDFNGEDTFIQKEAIAYDYGLFPSPDAFFSIHTQNMSILKKFLYEHLGRKIMTRNVNKIRNSK